MTFFDLPLTVYVTFRTLSWHFMNVKTGFDFHRGILNFSLVSSTIFFFNCKVVSTFSPKQGRQNVFQSGRAMEQWKVLSATMVGKVFEWLKQ